MANNYTHINILIDRSGSMESIRDDTIGGYNAFLQEQQKTEDRTTLTLVQFDTQDPFEVIYRAVPLTEADPLSRESYVPRAMTPLFDALGRCINDCESMPASMEDSERPGQVLFVVVTDGQENSSREFNKQQVGKRIDQKKADGWEFVFLSADLDAMNEAMVLGVPHTHSIAYDADSAGVRNAWTSLSSNTTQYRTSGAPESLHFKDEDREQQRNERKRTQGAAG